MPFFDKNLLLHDYNRIQWDPNNGNFEDIGRNSQLIFYLKKVIHDKKICLVHNNQFDENTLNQSDLDFVIFNCSDHHCGSPYFDINKPYLILGSNFNHRDYYPFHLLFSVYLANREHVESDKPRQHIASCINRSPRIGRIYNRILIQDFVYPNFKCIWFRAEESNGPVPDPQQVIEQLGQENYAKFQYIDNNSPVYQPTSEYNLCSQIHDYQDSYLNLVTESRLENIGFLTEKIYKPIRAAQLFLVQGPPGAVNHLRTLGFDTFDDYINHSYDTVEDWIQRTDCVHQELQRIYNNIPNIFIETHLRRQKNLQILRNFEQDNVWNQVIKNKIL
jgi:hypothetical protein